MKIFNMLNSGNVLVTKTEGVFSILEHQSDLSLSSPAQAVMQHYMSEQGLRKRQLVINLNNQGVILQNGAMQWIAGGIKATTDVKGLGDLVGKALRGRVTGEAAINPLYKGVGMIVCEPTYKHLILHRVSPDRGLVARDGLFLACEDTLSLNVSLAKSFSSVAGNQGLFNMVFRGEGVAALESPIPYEEIIRVDLSEGEEIRIDGPFAVMWDEGLAMTVERSSKSLIGSAVGGEGLVNVYRGVGSVWLSTSAAEVK
jgi:uncharacterized protein (AIM24 family)